MIVEALDRRLGANPDSIKIAYKDGIYFATYKKEFIITSSRSLIGTFTMSYFDRICITEFRKAEENPATDREIQEMGFGFNGLGYPLKGIKYGN